MITLLCSLFVFWSTACHAASQIEMTMKGDNTLAVFYLENALPSQSSTYTFVCGDDTSSVTVSDQPVYFSRTYTAGNDRTLVVTGDLDNLAVFECSSMSLTSLTVQGLQALTHLACQNNELTTLVIEETPLLTTLDCSSNLLTALTFSIAGLSSLNCSYNKELHDLSLSGATSLTRLNCNATGITSLTPAEAPLLTYLSCAACSLNSLDVSQNQNLTVLDCAGSGLHMLTLSGAHKLSTLYCEKNNIVSLDLSGCPNLTFADCTESGIHSLTTGNDPQLQQINASRNSIGDLDISNLPLLSQLYANRSGVTSLYTSASSNNRFLRLSIEENSLDSLNLTRYTGLYNVNIRNCGISKLSCYSRENSELFDCSGNHLDISNLPDYKDIALYHYAPQANVEIPASLAPKTDYVDMSRQYVARWGCMQAADSKFHQSAGSRVYPTFVWHYEDGTPLPDSLYWVDNKGLSHFAAAVTGKVYCDIIHPNFPDLSGEKRLHTSPITLGSVTPMTYWGTLEYRPQGGEEEVSHDNIALTRGDSYTIPTSYGGYPVTRALLNGTICKAGDTVTPTRNFTLVIEVAVPLQSAITAIGSPIGELSNLADGLWVILKNRSNDKIYMYENAGLIYANSTAPSKGASSLNYVFKVKKVTGGYTFQSYSTGNFIAPLSDSQMSTGSTAGVFNIESQTPTGTAAAANYFYLLNNGLTMNASGTYPSGKSPAGFSGTYSQYTFIPVTIESSTLHVEPLLTGTTLFYTAEGKRAGSDTVKISMSEDFEISTTYNGLYTIQSYRIDGTGYLPGDLYTPGRDFTGTAIVKPPFETSTVVNGDFGENTSWYLIGIGSNTYWKYAPTSTYVQAVTTCNPADDNYLWCVTGNPEDGFHFYNRAAGADKLLEVTENAGASMNSLSESDAKCSFALENSTTTSGSPCLRMIGGTQFITATAGGDAGHYKLGTGSNKTAMATNSLTQVAAKAYSTIAEAVATTGYVGSYTAQQIALMNSAYNHYLTAKNEGNFTEMVTTVFSQTPIAFDVNKYYRLVNVAYPNRAMTYNGTGPYALSYDVQKPIPAQIWKFEKGAGASTYYLRNVSCGLYMGTITQSTLVPMSSSKVSYVMLPNSSDSRQWCFYKSGNTSGNTALHAASSQSYMVVGWNSSETPTWWMLSQADDVVEITPAGNETVTLGEFYDTWCGSTGPYSYKLPSGFTAYTVDDVDDVSVKALSTGTILPAATPIIYKGTIGTSYVLLATTETGSINGNNRLKGTTEEMSLSTTHPANLLTYPANSNQPSFVLTQSGTLMAGKAYLDAYVFQSSRLEIFFDGVPLAIHPVTAGQQEGDNEESYYDLTGRRVTHPTKGLYIKKGKKIWIK